MPSTTNQDPASGKRQIVIIAGGVGAARFIDGMQQIHPADSISVICYVGDDLTWNGLKVCPDIDTVIYTLAGIEGELGWGIQDDFTSMLDELTALGDEAWFRIGNRDLATHLIRNRILQNGGTLSEATEELCRRRNVSVNVRPVTDDNHPTMIGTTEGILTFQEYFVARQSEPVITNFEFPNKDSALPAPGILDLISTAETIYIAPSNPFVSIEPILQIPGIRDALIQTKAPKIAISPIIGGKAIKGPAAKMLYEMGHDVSAVGVAKIYAPFIDLFVYDTIDQELTPSMDSLAIQTAHCDTIMKDRLGRKQVAVNVTTLLNEVQKH